MELYLTGGVLFSLLLNIKKEQLSRRETRNGKEDPTSELEMMLHLWSITQGHAFSLNKDSLRSKLTNYKNCDVNGNTLIPLEAKFNDLNENENVNYLLFDKEATLKRISIFINTFINLDNTAAIERFVYTINEIVASDILIRNFNSDNAIYSDIINNIEKTIALDEYLLNIVSFVVSSHIDNRLGKDTLSYITSEAYSPKPSNLKVDILALSPEIIEKYRQELMEPTISRSGWDDYIRALKNEFSNVKIYYDPDHEYPFNEIYVPSSISNVNPLGIRYKNPSEFKIDYPTCKEINAYSRNILISGVGGLGKSMLLRHLLLDTIENDIGHLPIFISVRNYTSSHNDFFDFIYDQCLQYDPNLSKDKLQRAFTAQQCILFLDGFDEIPFEHLHSFIQQYNKFIRIDFGNTIILSSRPVGGSIPPHFAPLYLLPFTPAQACELIDKLTAIQHNDELGKNFKHELKHTLFITHKEYTESPLLLTLMLRIFEQNASIPKDKFDFYYNAYEVLSHKHDALKEDGGYSRKYKTGLNPTNFANCFKEFCAYSLLFDGKISFNESEMLKYYEMIKIKKENNWDFELKDFIYDATVSTGLMYFQGDRYNFIHRSIQEFFCAWFFSNQEDNVLLNIALQLQRHGEGLVWGTYELLDERIHYKMEKYVYFPYFKGIFGLGQPGVNYRNFLTRLFNEITYHHSTGTQTYWTEIKPSETLYQFCMKDRRGNIADDELGFPEYDEFEDECIYDFYITKNTMSTDTESNIPRYYNTDKYGDPKLVGHTYTFQMSDVLDTSNRHKKIVDIIMDDDFPLRQEYRKAEAYWIELKEKYMENKDETPLFDLLH